MTKTIQIRTVNGVENVRAVLIGPLAVHLMTDDDSYTITHLATGLCVPFKFDAAAQARKAARDLIRLKNDWDTIDLDYLLSDDFRRKSTVLLKRHGGLQVFTRTAMPKTLSTVLNQRDALP